MKLAVVGSRGFRLRMWLCQVLNARRSRISMIITGGAAGVDSMAEDWARAHRVSRMILEADWRPGGVLDYSAGPRRNTLIVEAADSLLAFWDGQSRGTRDVIAKANAKGIPVEVIRFVVRPEPSPLGGPGIKRGGPEPYTGIGMTLTPKEKL